MVRYDRLVLNKLLDSYESSRLFYGGNKVAVRIAFSFSRKTIPAYFDESSLTYEEIHAAMERLEADGLVAIGWKQGHRGHIIDKVYLCVERLNDVYAYTKRTPKHEQVEEMLRILEEQRRVLGEAISGARQNTSEGSRNEHSALICLQVIEYLEERIKCGKSVKEFIDLGNTEEASAFLKGIAAVESNRKSCYIREFSIEHFHDSKMFEMLERKIVRAIQMFGDEYANKDIEDILAEYRIYHTPNYVYFKGEVTLGVGDVYYKLGGLHQGAGISGEDLERISFLAVDGIRKVITIENLTTFFRWKEPDSLLVYLGGYHNAVRRRLLRMIYEILPDAEYYHFGDIDIGGFLIYEDLCRKTKIPFRCYHMDLETLRQYEKYAKPLTEGDRKRAERLLAERPYAKYSGLVRYMLERDVKLEQECILY